jgi:hypothetical protein
MKKFNDFVKDDLNTDKNIVKAISALEDSLNDVFSPSQYEKIKMLLKNITKVNQNKRICTCCSPYCDTCSKSEFAVNGFERS